MEYICAVDEYIVILHISSLFITNWDYLNISVGNFISILLELLK